MEQYLDLLKTIKKKGTYKPAARENMPGTQSLFGHQLRHDLSEGFPILTTKKIFWKGVIVELLWFLRGDTNIKYLVDNGVNIWNEDAYGYYCKTHKKIIDSLPTNDPFVLLCKKPVPLDEFITNIKNSKLEDLKTFEKHNINYSYGDCGFQYGKVWRKWERVYNDEQGPGFENKVEFIDQIKNLIVQLKKSPESRRHIVTAIDPSHDADLALYWCHALFQFNCRPLTKDHKIAYAIKNELYDGAGGFTNELIIPKYYLDCQLYQRSADVFLGVPFNISSYALLTHILAKICNMIPGEFIHTFGDVHIYQDHMDAVEEQLQRIPAELPKLIEMRDIDWNLIGDTSDFSSLDFGDFMLENYNPQPSIKAELSTGIKK